MIFYNPQKGCFMEEVKTVDYSYSVDDVIKLPDLPPDVDLESKSIMRQLVKATRALAELDNKAAQLPNQDILISNIVLSEARDSSAIENIVTTNDLLYKANVMPEPNVDPVTKEVRDYNGALWLGMELIKQKPLSESIFVKLVQEIKHNTAGIRKTPGTVVKNITTGEVLYVPPQSEVEIKQKLKNLEEFLYGVRFMDLDPLIKMAVMHYQFESIHPFGDGNGRTGRISNILWLVQEGLLHRPILFLSKYYLEHRAEYYEGFQKIHISGEWENWIVYILKSVEQTAKYTTYLIDRILSARIEYKKELQNKFSNIYSHELLEAIFSSPYFRIENLVNNLGISRQTASKYLKILSSSYIDKSGNLKQLLTVQRVGRDNIYFNQTLFEILTRK